MKALVNPVANPQDTREFLEKTLQDQAHLTAIHPEGRRPTEGHDFGSDVEAALGWALERNAQGLNVYFAVNRIRDGLNKRANKNDISAVRFVHVDIDPPKGALSFTAGQKAAAYDRLVAAVPSVVIWSGNGWQALWRVDDSLSIANAEEINRRLIAVLGGDEGTQDASRLLRVPGLINYPNQKKQSVGRIPALASIKAGDDGSVHSGADMMAALPAVPEKERNTRVDVALGEWAMVSADSLGLASDDILRSMIDKPKGDNRSDDTFAFACEALRRGLTAEQIVGALLNPANTISAHCLDQNDPPRAAKRAIEAARAEKEVGLLARRYERERERRLAAGEHNQPHDETRVWTLDEMIKECVFIEDGAQVADTSRPGHILSQSDFRASTAASKMKVTVAGKGESERMIVKRTAEMWLEHPERRSVATVTFRPGAGAITVSPGGQTALNSWGGFQFTTPTDDWQTRSEPFEMHVRWLFGRDADAFLDWLAHIAQRAGELPSFGFLHIARNHGMGRNWIASVLGRIFVGYTALAFDLSGTLRTGYNGVLAGKVLAVVDEVDEGSSQRKYQIQQEIKQLVTEETRTINPKYGRQRQEWNCCRLLIFSNSPAALPLEEDDRRMYVVECVERPQSPEYYQNLYTLKGDNEFITSVAQFLTLRDISNFNAGQRPPLTDAKVALLNRCRSEAEQALHNLVKQWPVDIITNEELYDILGGDRPTGTALRHALDRSGIIRVCEWRGAQSILGGRPKVTAYALRNADTWKTASPAAVRAEIGRIEKTEKEAVFYG